MRVSRTRGTLTQKTAASLKNMCYLQKRKETIFQKPILSMSRTRYLVGQASFVTTQQRFLRTWNLITYSWSFSNRHTVPWKHKLLKVTEKKSFLQNYDSKKCSETHRTQIFPRTLYFFHYITNLTGLDFNLLLQADNYKLWAKLAFLAWHMVSFLSFIAKWLLYAPQGLILKFLQSAHKLFMWFVWISGRTANISLHNFIWLIFLTEAERLPRGKTWIFKYNSGKT